MNWLDIVILILLGIGLIKGIYDGIIKQVVSLFALIVGIYLCSGVAGWLQGYLALLDWFPQQATVITSYILGFVLIVGIIIMAGSIVNRVIDATPLSVFNHLLGGLLGFLLMVLFLSLIFNLIEQMDTKAAILSQEIKVESRLYYYIKSIVSDFLPGNLFKMKDLMFDQRIG